MRRRPAILVPPDGSGAHPWPERPYPQGEFGAYGSGQVNNLVLVNNSDRPLILLAGEIVTGGKQDRIVGKDRIVQPHSDPIDLSVFCVEPHRWVETAEKFGAMNFLMAQPSVRRSAMADKNQQKVWDQVGRSSLAMAEAAPGAAGELQATSSYARVMENREVKKEVEAIAAPLQDSYGHVLRELRARNAVGVVVAVKWTNHLGGYFCLLVAASNLLAEIGPLLHRRGADRQHDARPPCPSCRHPIRSGVS